MHRERPSIGHLRPVGTREGCILSVKLQVSVMSRAESGPIRKVEAYSAEENLAMLRSSKSASSSTPNVKPRAKQLEEGCMVLCCSTGERHREDPLTAPSPETGHNGEEQRKVAAVSISFTSPEAKEVRVDGHRLHSQLVNQPKDPFQEPKVGGVEMRRLRDVKNRSHYRTSQAHLLGENTSRATQLQEIPSHGR